MSSFGVFWYFSQVNGFLLPCMNSMIASALRHCRIAFDDRLVMRAIISIKAACPSSRTWSNVNYASGRGLLYERIEKSSESNAIPRSTCFSSKCSKTFGATSFNLIFNASSNWCRFAMLERKIFSWFFSRMTKRRTQNAISSNSSCVMLSRPKDCNVFF